MFTFANKIDHKEHKCWRKSLHRTANALLKWPRFEGESIKSVKELINHCISNSELPSLPLASCQDYIYFIISSCVRTSISIIWKPNKNLIVMLMRFEWVWRWANCISDNFARSEGVFRKSAYSACWAKCSCLCLWLVSVNASCSVWCDVILLLDYTISLTFSMNMWWGYFKNTNRYRIIRVLKPLRWYAWQEIGIKSATP